VACEAKIDETFLHLLTNDKADLFFSTAFLMLITYVITSIGLAPYIVVANEVFGF